MIYILIVGVVLVFAFFSNHMNEEKFDAKFGNASDHLNIFNKGFSIVGGLRALTLEKSFSNALIIGPSGSGKTSAILINSVYTLSRGNTSMVVNDPSNEVYLLTSGYLAKQNFSIHCFDLTENSDTFNPIAFCKPEDVFRIADIIMRNANVQSKSDPYWHTSACGILEIFLEYVVRYGKPEEKHLTSVLKLVEIFNAEPTKIDALFIHASPKLLLRYKAMIAIPEKTLKSSISVVLAGLKIFNIPSVARCTATDFN